MALAAYGALISKFSNPMYTMVKNGPGLAAISVLFLRKAFA